MSTKNCPYCEEEIQAKATKCRYCKEWLNDNEIKNFEIKESQKGLLEKSIKNQQNDKPINAKGIESFDDKEYTIDDTLKVYINEEKARLKIYSENNEIIVKSSNSILQINQQEIDIADIEAINYYLENNTYHFVFEIKNEELRFSFDFLNNENVVMEIINFSKKFWEKHILEKNYQTVINEDFFHIGNVFISKKGITKDSSMCIFDFGNLDNSIPWNGMNNYFQNIKAELHSNFGIEYKIMYDNNIFTTIPLSVSNSAIIPDLFHKVYLYATKHQTNLLIPPNFLKKSKEQKEIKNSHNNNNKIITPECTEVDCPYCNEIISSCAKKCKHCGEFLDKNASNNSESKISDPNRDMSFLACITRGFTSLLDFKGRSTRKEYWSYAITLQILLYPLSAMSIGLINSGYGLFGNITGEYLFGVFLLLCLTIIGNFLSLAILFRRCNDVSDNKIIRFLPYISAAMSVGTIIILLFAFITPIAMQFFT